jgi:hypothetical protein
MARWSGASQIAFRALNQAFASVPKIEALQLYIADTDSETTQQFFSDNGDVPKGAGETYWLAGG